MYEHKNGIVDGFTKRYKISKLVYYEAYSNVNDAILREKRLKGLLRAKKNALIEQDNPDWNDLSISLFPNLL
jgi:putative endonuclease